MKKSAWQKSEFGQIKSVNIFNGAYHAIISMGTLYFAEPTTTLQTLAILGASTFFFSIFKGSKTNSKGQPFTKE